MEMKSDKINSGLSKDGEQCLSSARTLNCRVELPVINFWAEV